MIGTRQGGDQSLQNEAFVKTPGCKASLSVTSIASSPTHNNDQVAHSLILTDPESVPYELPGGGVVTDLETTQEEADTIILQQVDSQIGITRPSHIYHYYIYYDIFMTNVPPLGCTSFMTNVPPL